MDYLLPATVYQPPTRLGRARQLNTIIEDNEEMMNGCTSEGEGTSSDDTVIGRPAVLDVKFFAQPPQRTRQRAYTHTRGPPSTVSSECDEDEDLPQPSSRSSCSGSDAGTVFSESCPSLTGSNASDATSFAVESCRNSVASRGSRNRYPSLLIPRGSWHLDGEVKQLPLGMSPSTKVRLSPETLNSLSRLVVPSLDAPPSLADASSVRSESPRLLPASSAPATPDMHNLELTDGQLWGTREQQLPLDTPLEIALDDDHSILLSAEEAHSALRLTPCSAISRRTDDIVYQFPLIPGATPIDLTPVTPNIPKCETFELLPEEFGVQLPAQALEMLHNLNRQQYAESLTGTSVSSGEEQEMKECPAVEVRPQSWAVRTPASEYSISQLSIPSPGGFFASLQSGARRTWCAPPTRKASPPPPSSTTAENFYSAPWNKQSQVKETIIEYEHDNDTDGPPTVRQATFDLGIASPCEDTDMYGSSEHSASHEYDESYEETLKQAAEVNVGRTSNWLADQTSYLSALRENNTVNDPADLPIALDSIAETVESENHTAEQFLEKAKAAITPEMRNGSTGQVYPAAAKVATFLEAFTFQQSETKRTDAFFHAASRLDSVHTTRIALPKRHVQSLLNNHTSKTLEPEHARPKYRGPFSQNPRKTGDFTLAGEHAELYELEREQTALAAIKPNLWTMEAQRTILYNGRLMANSAAAERLTTKDAESAAAEQAPKTKKKRPRVLDLAGAATASWAWAAAAKWPNTQVFTVQTKQQAELAHNYPAGTEDDVESYRPDTPKNHKVLSVPHLWQMPFRDNYFDIISARTLHMYLRACPVPGVESINEWNMTLKECMRVLKPGGVLDFFVMDSGVSNDNASCMADVNLSPNNMSTSNALPTPAVQPKCEGIAAQFTSELQQRGYEADGGCGHLMARLKRAGFVGVKRQWIGLPMGRAENTAAASRGHQRNSSNVSATSHWINQFQLDNARKPAFRMAPRPISEVSVSKIVDQYAGIEAVQGPVGSTTDVSDMSALLGELLWEEWFVRLRIESGRYEPNTLLDGVEEQFSQWRRSGKAAWGGVIGWARKPSKKEVRAIEVASIANYPSCLESLHLSHDFAIETPLPSPAAFPPPCQSAPVGLRRRASVRHSRVITSAGVGLTIDTDYARRRGAVADWSTRINEVSVEDFTMSALARGDVGEIPMMIVR